ncbi:hypothetical protein JCM11957_08220 [Caminibacter profundus]
MKKFFLFLPIFLLADINPFNAGINSNYGLTPQEKIILENKKEIKTIKKDLSLLEKDLKNLKIKLISYDESISLLNEKLASFNTFLSELDATKSSLLAFKKEIENIDKKYKDLDNKVKSLENKIYSIQNEVVNIKNTIKEITKVQNENFMYLKNAIDLIIKEIKKQKPLSPKEAMTKAKQYYFSGKLERAKELFLFTLSKNYLPATSAYYLGEIAFKKAEYKKALGYYKKSIEIYPKKTSFSERLLYHTGISFEKIGDKKSAKLTFKKLVNDYPNSKYSKLAQKELEKLK